MKVKHDSHRLTGKSEQNTAANRSFSLEPMRKLFVAQCSLVKVAQCTLKSDEFENSYSLLYVFLKS